MSQTVNIPLREPILTSSFSSSLTLFMILFVTYNKVCYLQKTSVWKYNELFSNVNYHLEKAALNIKVRYAIFKLKILHYLSKRTSAIWFAVEILRKIKPLKWWSSSCSTWDYQFYRSPILATSCLTDFSSSNSIMSCELSILKENENWKNWEKSSSLQRKLVVEKQGLPVLKLLKTSADQNNLQNPNYEKTLNC